ncbi:uncharacterized protein LAESUDRAFT_275759 [Laetiporus sulphureus 93-53]|uniref:Uncharacterized protein n=1 Tax=Laetiporus sulphureus 93-53 TaxID=1314785 RepID=A0A165HCB8_9APHY|nr:uncharacterized protein LAESUDRAFT_275759 [Laetiporus sulphureus 93-53]KZT11541.1 hypothetical protein LAESUDRAFT_275759 [Laetiporus sulphureus 93-53]
MVHLSVLPAKGNPSSRFFPFHGYLGLTPVRVEGIVRTRLDEDRKPLPAKSISISVRCYESRVSRSRGTVHSAVIADYTVVLWTKPESAQWADVGDLELPFKVSLPKRASGFSTANFQVYRTFWRVEATLEHVPITGVGHRLLRYYDLALIRYDVPSYPSHLPPVPPASSLYLQTSKPRAPVLRYNISTPSHPVGPDDIIFASLSLQPLDRNVSVRSATLVVERRIDLLNPSPYSSTSAGSPPPTPLCGSYLASDEIPTPSSSSSQLSFKTPYDSSSNLLSPQELALSTSSRTEGSTTASSSLSFLSSPQSSLPMPINIPPHPARHPSAARTLTATDTPAKTVTSTVTTTEGSGFTCEAHGVWSKTLTLQFPTSRPQSKWALGETMHSEHVAIRFFLRATVRVSGPAGSDSIELEPREIMVAATNEAERRMALAKYSEQRENIGRSKSKSPWRARHEPASLEEADVNARSHSGEISSRVVTEKEDAHRHQHEKYGPSSTSTSGAKGKEHKSTRRPHTSAGPRDKSNISFLTLTRNAPLVTPVDVSIPVEQHIHMLPSSRGHVRHGSGPGSSESTMDREKRARDREREKVKEDKRLKTQGGEREHVRAWEEELTRIEVQSRRSSSHLFGLWGLGRRKQLSQRS